jgi:hypothetical protein
MHQHRARRVIHTVVCDGSQMHSREGAIAVTSDGQQVSAQGSLSQHIRWLSLDQSGFGFCLWVLVSKISHDPIENFLYVPTAITFCEGRCTQARPGMSNPVLTSP